LQTVERAATSPACAARWPTTTASCSCAERARSRRIELRNGVIDTNDLLRKITEEATAATARSAREIELVKTIYELKHTINR